MSALPGAFATLCALLVAALLLRALYRWIYWRGFDRGYSDALTDRRVKQACTTHAYVFKDWKDRDSATR